MSFIVVMAELAPKEGAEEKIIPLAEALVEETLKEEGNIDYKFLKSVKDGTFMFVEQWESKEILNAHLQTEHFLKFGENIEDLVAQDLIINVYEAESTEL